MSYLAPFKGPCIAIATPPGHLEKTLHQILILRNDKNTQSETHPATEPSHNIQIGSFEWLENLLKELSADKGPPDINADFGGLCNANWYDKMANKLPGCIILCFDWREHPLYHDSESWFSAEAREHIESLQKPAIEWITKLRDLVQELKIPKALKGLGPLTKEQRSFSQPTPKLLPLIILSPKIETTDVDPTAGVRRNIYRYVECFDGITLRHKSDFTAVFVLCGTESSYVSRLRALEESAHQVAMEFVKDKERRYLKLVEQLNSQQPSFSFLSNQPLPWLNQLAASYAPTLPAPYHIIFASTVLKIKWLIKAGYCQEQRQQLADARETYLSVFNLIESKFPPQVPIGCPTFGQLRRSPVWLQRSAQGYDVQSGSPGLHATEAHSVAVLMAVRILLLSGDDILSHDNQVLFTRVRDMLLMRGGDKPAWDVFNLLSLANLHRCVARRISAVAAPVPHVSGWTSPSHHLEAAVRLLSEVAKFVASEPWISWIQSAQQLNYDQTVVKSSRFVGRLPLVTTETSTDEDPSSHNPLEEDEAELATDLMAIPFAHYEAFGHIHMLSPFQISPKSLSLSRLLNIIICVQTQASYANLRTDRPSVSAVSVSALLSVNTFFNFGLIVPALKFYALMALPMTVVREAAKIPQDQILQRHVVYPPLSTPEDRLFTEWWPKHARTLLQAEYNRSPNNPFGRLFSDLKDGQFSDIKTFGVNRGFLNWYRSHHGFACGKNLQRLMGTRLSGYMACSTPSPRGALTITACILERMLKCLSCVAKRPFIGLQPYESKALLPSQVLETCPTTSLKGLLDILLRHHLLRMTARVDGEKDRHCIRRMLLFVSSSEDFMTEIDDCAEKPYPVVSAANFQAEIPPLTLVFLIESVQNQLLYFHITRRPGFNCTRGASLAGIDLLEVYRRLQEWKFELYDELYTNRAIDGSGICFIPRVLPFYALTHIRKQSSKSETATICFRVPQSLCRVSSISNISFVIDEKIISCNAQFSINQQPLDGEAVPEANFALIEAEVPLESLSSRLPGMNEIHFLSSIRLEITEKYQFRTMMEISLFKPSLAPLDGGDPPNGDDPSDGGDPLDAAVMFLSGDECQTMTDPRSAPTNEDVYPVLAFHNMNGYPEIQQPESPAVYWPLFLLPPMLPLVKQSLDWIFPLWPHSNNVVTSSASGIEQPLLGLKFCFRRTLTEMILRLNEEQSNTIASVSLSWTISHPSEDGAEDLETPIRFSVMRSDETGNLAPLPPSTDQGALLVALITKSATNEISWAMNIPLNESDRMNYEVAYSVLILVEGVMQRSLKKFVSHVSLIWESTGSKVTLDLAVSQNLEIQCPFLMDNLFSSPTDTARTAQSNIVDVNLKAANKNMIESEKSITVTDVKLCAPRKPGGFYGPLVPLPATEDGSCSVWTDEQENCRTVYLDQVCDLARCQLYKDSLPLVTLRQRLSNTDPDSSGANCIYQFDLENLFKAMLNHGFDNDYFTDLTKAIVSNIYEELTHSRLTRTAATAAESELETGSHVQDTLLMVLLVSFAVKLASGLTLTTTCVIEVNIKLLKRLFVDWLDISRRRAEESLRMSNTQPPYMFHNGLGAGSSGTLGPVGGGFGSVSLVQRSPLLVRRYVSVIDEANGEEKSVEDDAHRHCSRGDRLKVKYIVSNMTSHMLSLHVRLFPKWTEAILKCPDDAEAFKMLPAVLSSDYFVGGSTDWECDVLPGAEEVITLLVVPLRSGDIDLPLLGLYVHNFAGQGLFEYPKLHLMRAPSPNVQLGCTAENGEVNSDNGGGHQWMRRAIFWSRPRWSIRCLQHTVDE